MRYMRERATYLVRVALEVRRGLVRLTLDRVCCRLGVWPVSLPRCAAGGKNVHVFCESGLTAAPNLSVALWRPVSVSPVEPALFEESASEACCV